MKQKSFNVNNIFYGVIGIATLMLAIMGATFAYFTATSTNTGTITGNMATVGIDVTVQKMTTVDVDKGGLIPMSNNMVEQAITKNQICVDDNGNAVCQIYKITVNNESTSSIFADLYVTLSGGSGTSVDYDLKNDGTQDYRFNTAGTTMRWAQAFCSAEDGGVVTACSTGNKISNVVYSTLRGTTSPEITALGGASVKDEGLNRTEIKDAKADVTGSIAINNANNSYEMISRNYIRVSDHTLDSYKYNRTDDVTSALVFNQYLDANPTLTTTPQTGTSISTYTYSQVYYIVVWLSENGLNQTANKEGTGGVATSTADFFKGNVTAISAEGNEVTATFSGHVRITPDTPIR